MKVTIEHIFMFFCKKKRVRMNPLLLIPYLSLPFFFSLCSVSRRSWIK